MTFTELDFSDLHSPPTLKPEDGICGPLRGPLIRIRRDFNAELRGSVDAL